MYLDDGGLVVIFGFFFFSLSYLWRCWSVDWHVACLLACLGAIEIELKGGERAGCKKEGKRGKGE